MAVLVFSVVVSDNGGDFHCEGEVVAMTVTIVMVTNKAVIVTVREMLWQ
jgi:hypothetical protein